jgi:uncharacterized protein YutE (UPF0331/DUF86 family)
VVDRDLVLAKVETLERSLARIDSAQQRASLDPLDRQDITVLNLQRAVQAMLDLAAHVVACTSTGSSIRRSSRRSCASGWEICAVSPA